jgi:hypothetical protein
MFTGCGLQILPGRVIQRVIVAIAEEELVWRHKQPTHLRISKGEVCIEECTPCIIDKSVVATTRVLPLEVRP